MQKAWRTRVAFKLAREEMLRRVRQIASDRRDLIALENHSSSLIANSYRCLLSRRILVRRRCCRRLAEGLAEGVCDVEGVYARHEDLYKEHGGFMGQVILDAPSLLRAVSWDRRPNRHPLVNQEGRLKMFPKSQKLVQGTVTLAVRAARTKLTVEKPQEEAGVVVLHRGPGGVVPIPLSQVQIGDGNGNGNDANPNSNPSPCVYKGIDDDAEFAGWEGTALPNLTLKLQLVSANINRSAKPIPTKARKKLGGVGNIVGRMGMNVRMMREKRERAEVKQAEADAKAKSKAKGSEETETETDSNTNTKYSNTKEAEADENLKIVIRLYEDVSEQLLTRLESAFLACDVDGDGVLSLKEVQMAALTNRSVRELLQLPPVFTKEFDEVFEKLDKDQNDAVSFEEVRCTKMTTKKYHTLVVTNTREFRSPG